MRKLMWFALGMTAAALAGTYCLLGRNCLAAAGVTAIVLAAAFWWMRRHRKVRIAVAMLSGALAGFLVMAAFDGVYLAAPRTADGRTDDMCFTATEYARQTDYGSSVDGIVMMQSVPYKVRIYFPAGLSVAPGDTLRGKFTLKATMPGCSGENNYLAGQGIFLRAHTSQRPAAEHAQTLPWYGYPAWVRQTVSRTLHDCLPQDCAGFAVALLTGDKAGIDYQTEAAFEQSGISHIIAVSGLHVTILFSLIFMLVGGRRVPAVLLGIPSMFFFAAVAGFSPSIMRACLMHSLMLVAMLTDREYDSPTALGFAVSVMLLLDPWTVTSVSFQLSVSCMAGIILFAEPIREYLMDKRRLGRWKRWRGRVANGFSSSVGMTVGATIFATPLCAYYFGVVSLVSILTNLLTLWLISFIFYGAVILCVIGALWSGAGRLIGWLLAWPIRYVLCTARVIASFPLSAVYLNNALTVAWLVFVYVELGIHLLRKKRCISMFVCHCTIVLCLVLGCNWIIPLFDECRVTVLDVGQGQCILLQSEGKTFVVDCGGDSDTGSAERAVAALRSRGIFRIDGVILTHYDRDHAAGVQYLLQQMKASKLYLPNCADADGTSATLPRDISSLTVSRTTGISYGQTKITLVPSLSELSDNESGICVLFQTENCDILITGDRSSASELELMHQIELPELEVLIVGHHGSKYATSMELLQQTRPKTAIISVGAGNLYGHPADEVLERLAAFGCEILRTDEQGCIVYRR